MSFVDESQKKHLEAGQEVPDVPYDHSDIVAGEVSSVERQRLKKGLGQRHISMIALAGESLA